MAEQNETRVFYRAIANFASLRREIAQTKRALASMKEVEAQYNVSAAKDRAASTKASNARAKALSTEKKSLQLAIAQAARYNKTAKEQTVVTRAATQAINAQNRALSTNAKRFIEATAAAKAYSRAQKSVTNAAGTSTAMTRSLKEEVKALDEATDARDRKIRKTKEDVQASKDASAASVRFVEDVGNVNEATGEVVETIDSAANSKRGLALAIDRARNSFQGFFRDADNGSRAVVRLDRGTKLLYRGLRRFGDWRPRLTPPFIALIPIIGAVSAALNPLIALLGAVGTAAFGLVSNIGSLAGAFIALPGILSAVVAGIGSVIASMGGVGSVFKTYSAMQKAVGKNSGTTGETQAERTDRLARAEHNLSKAQKNVQRAQENLNRARREALEDLIDLRLEVSRSALTEERAIADLQLAQENYWNVMADPGSTAGDKLDAAARIKEAEAELEDVRRRNIENQEALNEAERKGIENSDKVVDAQDSLTDAVYAQRDAVRALNEEQRGGSSGSSAATAINEYNEALNELSPSARTVVLALLALEDTWKAMRRELQEEMFSKFVNDMDRLPQLIQNLRNFLKPAAGEMGEFVSQTLRLLSSPEWNRDLALIGEQNGKILGNLGEMTLSLAKAFKDLIIAAEPFTDWLTDSFAVGAENFAEMVGNARETGQLARWLETVAVRLERWWGIVKNIGSTLFNYGAAASGFGDWISENLLEMTAGWAESAKRAREEGSPFQQYLEDIKPLLSEVNGLFGDFFAWFREESMKVENIQDAQDLVRLLREDLGPAIGEFLDVLAETELDEMFVSTLASIIESLTTVMDNGGGAALESFFSVVQSFFSGLADFVDDIDPVILEAALKFLGFLAAVSFVGKFTGLTKVLGLIVGLRLSKINALDGMFKRIAGLSALQFVGLLGVLSGLLAVSALGASGLMSWVGDLSSANYDQGVKTSPTQTKEGFVGDQQVNYGRRLAQGDNAGGFALPSSESRWRNDSTGLKDAGRVFEDWWGESLKKFETGKAQIDGFLAGVRESIKSWWGEQTAELDAIWKSIVNYFDTELPRFFGDVGSNFQKGWGSIASWYYDNFGIKFEQGWNQLVSFFTVSIPNFFTTIGEKFRQGWSTITDWFYINIGAKFEQGWNQIEGWFLEGVSNISTTFSGIQANLVVPVNWVIENVYNNGIRGFWNSIADALGFGKLPAVSPLRASPTAPPGRPVNRGQFADGGVLPGYTPGRDVHRFHSATGGTLDLSGGEAIMRPEWTKAIGGPRAVEEMNSKARRGQAFASGGIFDNLNGRSNSNNARTRAATSKSSNKSSGRGFANEVLDNIGAGAKWIADFFMNPMEYVKKGANAAIAGLMGGFGNTGFGRMISTVPSKIIDSLGGKAGSSVSSSVGGPSAGTPGMGWQRMIAAVRAVFPGTRLNSGFRPGDPTMHGKGRAIDIPPSSTIFNWIRANYPNSQALIYSPMGGRQLYNGRPHVWGEPYKSTHYNHVHWAMNQGGVLPKLYDQGGWIPHGGAAVNLSGKPEAVLNPAESAALKALLSGNGLATRSAFGASPATAISGAQPIVDASVNIENFVVNNPVPERTSDSLPNSIRKVGYMQNARAGGKN